MLKAIKSAVKTAIFKLEYLLFVKIVKGRNAWRLFDKAGIEGFGVNLIRLYFPVYYDNKKRRDSFSAPVKTQFTGLLIATKDKYQLNAAIASNVEQILRLPIQEEDPTLPYLDNYYFGVFDAAVLGAIMQTFKPAKIVEIGSGISTRYMKLYKDRFALDTKISCIDPYPRAEIDNVADLIIRQPFENIINDSSLTLQSADILFLDGSHYVFQGNDTLLFFFNFLPSVPKGVIIHIHDIYLPFDYPENVSRQLWTEQYILAALMLGGFNGFEVVYPAYYMSQNDAVVINTLKQANAKLKDKNFNLNIDHTAGFSFWMKRT